MTTQEYRTDSAMSQGKTLRRLDYVLIKDDQLTLTDRIIYSIISRFAYGNTKRLEKGQAPKRMSVTRLRRMTGFHLNTINRSVAQLQKLGYVGGGFEPLVQKGDRRWMGFRPIRVCGKTQLRQQVFNGIVDTNKQTKTPTWFCKTCGITRGSYYNMMNRYANAPVIQVGQASASEVPPADTIPMAEQDELQPTRESVLRTQYADESQMMVWYRNNWKMFAEIYGYDVLCAFRPGRDYSKYQSYGNSGLNYISGVGIRPKRCDLSSR